MVRSIAITIMLPMMSQPIIAVEIALTCPKIPPAYATITIKTVRTFRHIASHLCSVFIANSSKHSFLYLCTLR